MMLLLIGAWVTPVLPRTPIPLMGFGVVATALATITVPWDQGPLALYLPGSVAFALGYLMLGWTMWNEPALDTRSGSVPPPSFA
jgi:Na+/H+ antiporter NhaC